MLRKRARSLGIPCGYLNTGKNNAITDVPGVKVGHYTLSGEGINTGVTAILPHDGNLFQEKVVAATHVLNGFGKSIGLTQINELGQLETPILLTSTLSAPKAADALISWMLLQDDSITSLNPVVGECNDSYLNDIRGRHVQAEHVFAALDNACDGAVQEGDVGGGTGMAAFGFKGGIGTASRVLVDSMEPYTIGVLVMANFGTTKELLMAGIPVGRLIIEEQKKQSDLSTSRLSDGSIMMILATDAPLSHRQLQRVAKRCALGLARTGSVASHGSGDFIIAFQTADRINAKRDTQKTTRIVERLYEDGALLTPLFEAAVEASEEAIYNAICMANTRFGLNGHVRYALPLELTLEILRQHNRLIV